MRYPDNKSDNLGAEGGPCHESTVCLACGDLLCADAGAAHRNGLGGAAQRALHEQLNTQVAAGMSPDDYAERVFAGIAEGRFWLLPGDGFKPMFRRRADSILEETDPAPTFDRQASGG
jgi:hypothetical protein